MEVATFHSLAEALTGAPVEGLTGRDEAFLAEVLPGRSKPYMDINTQLILANAARAQNWEDRERADNSLEALIEEFDKRLPPGKTDLEADGKNWKPEQRR